MEGPAAKRSKRSAIDRRQFLFAGSLLAGGLLLDPVASHGAPSQDGGRYPFGRLTLDGPETPFPVPWLDKNGSHNQSPGPNSEPSSIYHFKGHVARCNDFKGMGTDNAGNRVAFGTPSTDFSVMSGEYWSDRTERIGGFSHI